jgi:hypothetical protein
MVWFSVDSSFNGKNWFKGESGAIGTSVATPANKEGESADKMISPAKLPNSKEHAGGDWF